MKLNLGCGQNVVDGWVNVDYAFGARLTKIPVISTIVRKLKLFSADWNEAIFVHDLTRSFPWPDSTADVAYSSHTLEHFSREDGRNFLLECHRVLRKGGILRIVVPDLRQFVTDYMEDKFQADHFVEKLGVLVHTGNSAIKKKLAPFIGFPHKCMYDNSRLLEILDEVGFDASSRLAFDSEIGDIDSIELKDRTENAVIVEGRRR